jgi:hypothetical protein
MDFLMPSNTDVTVRCSPGSTESNLLTGGIPTFFGLMTALEDLLLSEFVFNDHGIVKEIKSKPRSTCSCRWKSFS